MLLNRVVVGKGYKMTANNTTLTEPPAGYDSVSVVARWFFGGGADEDTGPGKSRCSLGVRRSRSV